MGPDTAKRTMLVYVVESVLLKIGKPSYELVLTKLQKDHGCHISECIEKPEYLKRVLQEIYGNASDEIFERIKIDLGDLVEQKYYRDFVEVMNSR